MAKSSSIRLIFTAVNIGESVEVDAIPTAFLVPIVEDAIVRHIDPDVLAATRMVEEQERAGLWAMADGWSA